MGLSNPPIPFPGGSGWLMLALWRSWSLHDLHSMSTLPSGTGQCWSQVGFVEPWVYDTFCRTGRVVTQPNATDALGNPHRVLWTGVVQVVHTLHLERLHLGSSRSVLKRKVRGCVPACDARGRNGYNSWNFRMPLSLLDTSPSRKFGSFSRAWSVTTTGASDSWSWRGFGIGSSTQVAK